MSGQPNTTVMPGSRLDGSRDRPATEPGGMECIECGCIFIGAEWHAKCAACAGVEPVGLYKAPK